MPELPDLAVVAEAFHAALAGRTLQRLEPVAPLVVRGTPTEVSQLEGRTLRRIDRRGKFLILDFEPDRLLVNPMLTGRFQLAAPGVRRPPATAAVLRFGQRARPPADAAQWTHDAAWLPNDRAEVEARYIDSTQMGKVYLVPAGIAREVPGFGPSQGPDGDDPELSLDIWRTRLRRHRGELKHVLRNQDFVAGIGNAYSDEILHAAGLAPYRSRSSLAPEEIDQLYAAVRSTLTGAIDLLRQRVPPTFERQVRDHLSVHLRGGQPCPRCGTRLTEVTAGGQPTTYCRGCQR